MGACMAANYVAGYIMSFLEALGIPQPDYNLGVDTGRPVNPRDDYLVLNYDDLKTRDMAAILAIRYLLLVENMSISGST